MLARLKATLLGKWLYRLSRHDIFGAPLRWLLDLGVAEQLDPAHWKAANRQHNARQAATLAAFRTRAGGAGQ
ncbi:hypothetical protein PVW47_11580 [Marinovum sp. SP66]|jgi:hypothetical protein|uniref:hypothetical protein n=1 Tax=Marinovum sp. SP66 TaxID=3028379 RepID=UPI00065B2448|nr:hypothetical protein [Marinovum sp. SP66]AKP00183.1 hypothetical protein MALG_05056 [Marinovum algicola DG 898]MDD9740415.1 hypothetical protein [Marinovum sp. SP66]